MKRVAFIFGAILALVVSYLVYAYFISPNGKIEHNLALIEKIKEKNSDRDSVNRQNKIERAESLIKKGLIEDAVKILVNEKEMRKKGEILNVFYENSISGKFIKKSLPERYGVTTSYYYLVPKERIDRFKYLCNHSYLSTYFDFVENKEKDIETLKITDIKKYKGVIGFRDFYKRIAKLDKFELNDKREEIFEQLKTAYILHAEEYTKYKNTIFLIENSQINIEEKNYDVDTEKMTIPVNFGGLLKYGAGGSPDRAVLSPFLKQGFSLKGWINATYFDSEYSFKFPFELAKKVFSKKNGKIITSAQLKFFVTPCDGFSGDRNNLVRGQYYVTKMKPRIIILEFNGINPIYLFTNIR